MLVTNFATTQAAAEAGDAAAQNELGVLYLTGKGTDIDLKLAVHWFFLAANQGSPLALANLGRCSAEGLGVEKDLGHAVKFLASAELMGVDDIVAYVVKELSVQELIRFAQQNNAHAQYFLGHMYASGNQVEVTPESSLNWFFQAADQDDPLALLVYGRCLANGIGLDKDLLQAESVLRKACDLAGKHVGSLGVRKVQSEIKLLRRRIACEVPALLVKVIKACDDKGKPEDQYMTDFLDGKLFVKALDQFGNMERRDESSNNDFRGDILEGYAESFGIGYNPYLYRTNADWDIEKDGQIGMIDVLKLRTKVFCMFCLEYIENRNCFLKLDPRSREFGEFAVIVKDVDEFLRRVRDAFDRLRSRDSSNYRMAYKRVDYSVDLLEKFNYSEFNKSDSYHWQKEYRIALDFTCGRFSQRILDEVTDFAKLTFQGEISTDTNPLSVYDSTYFEIGDIRDICECVPTDSLIGDCDMSLDIEVAPKCVPSHEVVSEPRHTFGRGVTAFCSDDGFVRLAVSRKAFFSALV